MKLCAAILILAYVPLLAEVKILRVDALSRVMRNDVPTDQDTAIEAARGEVESLQVVLHGPEGELSGSRLEATDLSGPDGAKIPAPTILREHYVKVTRSTPMSPLPPGDYPDALVPQSFDWQALPK
ncbi:MAG: hypothetical protein LDL31_13300, partial [Prosthecobacter sp.]|nr:hypothetical protein [Prosthecobacter sp.]